MTGRRQLAAMTCAALVACARPSPWVAPPPPLTPAPSSPTAAAASDGLTIPDAPVVLRGQCFVRTLQGHPCHGAPVATPSAPMRVEVCDGCRTDADCRAPRGGRCVVVPGNTCSPPARACRAPNDACSRCEGRPTFASPGCVHDGAGHAVCARTGPPPPAAPR